jgi:hypothetical protein
LALLLVVRIAVRSLLLKVSWFNQPCFTFLHEHRLISDLGIAESFGAKTAHIGIESMIVDPGSLISALNSSLETIR